MNKSAIVALALIALWWAALRQLEAWLARHEAEPELPPPPPADSLADALRVVGAPFQLPGGRWARYETELVECDPPIGANVLDVHDVSDPAHDARTCRHCRPLAGYSGVSYRSN